MYGILHVFNFLHNLVPFYPVGYTIASLKNSHQHHHYNGDTESSEVREKIVTTKFMSV